MRGSGMVLGKAPEESEQVIEMEFNLALGDRRFGLPG